MSRYAESGVDIEAGQKAVESVAEAVRSTYTADVVAGLGSFGGVISLASLQGLHDPLLVASTDGIGTKVVLAAQCRQVEGLGQDIVNHCANDLLVQGARPLFFLDYFATDRLDQELFRTVVTSIAAACRALGCSLLGGETAEMPGVYREGHFDLAGTMVGVVERARLLPRPDLESGDLLVGLASSGLHTNGYTLVRSIFQGHDFGQGSLAQDLLRPHRAYGPLLQPHMGKIKALAHITGGGLVENLPRILPSSLGARLERSSWPRPPLFDLIAREGSVSSQEMERVFNLGIGMVAVLARPDVAAFQAELGETSWVIGELISGPREVSWR